MKSHSLVRIRSKYARLLLSLLAASALWTAAGVLHAAEPEVASAELVDLVTANGFLHKGLYDLAIPEYRKFIANHGDHAKVPVARYGLSVCLFRTQKCEEAIRELEQLRGLKEFEFGAEVLAMLGQCQAAGQHYDRAAEAFSDIITRYRSHDLYDDAATGLVEALYRRGEYKEAETKCQSLASDLAGSPLEQRFLLLCATTDLALEQCERAGERLSKIKTGKATPAGTDQALLSLANCFARHDMSDQAAAVYAPMLESSTHPAYAEALLGMAGVRVSQKRWKDAEPLLDQFVDRFPDHPSISSGRLLRGRVAYESGNIDAALQLFQQAAKSNQAINVEAQYWTAKCLMRKEQFAAAADQLKSLAASSSGHALAAEIQFDLGVALARSDRDEAAIEAWKNLRSSFANQPLSGDALYLIALSEHRLKQWDRSLEHAAEFSSKYPKNALTPDALYLQAENRFRLEQYAEAVEAYRRFLTENRDDARGRTVRVRLGWCLHRLGRIDEASDVLASLGDAKPGDDSSQSAAWLLGDIAFQRGEWKNAAGQFAKYLAMSPKGEQADDALLKLALAHQRDGDFKSALADLDRLLAEFPASSHRLQANFERGQVLLSLGDDAKAAEAFRVVLAERDNARFASFAEKHLATLAMKKGEYQDAIRLLNDGAGNERGSKESTDAKVQLAQALIATEKYSDAEGLLKDLVESLADREADRTSEKRATAETEIGSKLAIVKALLVIAISRQDRAADAVELSQSIGAGELTSIDRELREALIYERARSLQSLGRRDEAQPLFAKLVNDNPGGPHVNHARFHLARIELEKKNRDSATVYLREILKSRGENEAAVPADLIESALYQLGVCEFESERFAAAAELLRELVEKFPQSKSLASASYFLGESLFRLNRLTDAAAAFDRATQATNAESVVGPALLRLGECLASLQKWSESESAFRRYLGANSDREQWYQARFGVGWALENQQKYDGAIAAYREVVAQHSGPTTARAQFQIGECLFAKKQYEEAARELLKVDILYSYPEWSAAALYEAGRCFAAMSKGDDAKKQFAAVVERFPKTAWAERAIKEMGGNVGKVLTSGTN